ncbi:hypothetical protein JS756_00885 [Streptomyces actuosus]|uniref:Uncharacterized protein n=1 Tax=Streptomyces actuosus TaxID=1885 RepID=A0ABS2VHX2_STRAS|nr:hypothetical protein [Streptomyces actuosus]MBN0042688.1 hypothetical protein [Streptomyces actuosus]
MADHRPHDPGSSGTPVPRDLPDQQATDGDDPWDVAQQHTGETPETDEGVPDTDEAGTGRRGAAHSGAVHPEHPVPDESPA